MSQPNGYAQHAQQAVRRNGYHVPQSSLAQHQPIADAEAHGSHVLLPTAGSDPEVDIMFDTPEKAAATHERGSDASPEVDIICTSSQERHRNSLHSLQHRQQGQYPSGMQNKGQQDADADITHASPLTQWKDSRSQLQLRSRDDLDLVDVPGAFHGTQHQPDLALANGMRGHTRQEEEHGMHATTSEPDFDWAAWQSPEDAPAGIAERLQRTRRPPKRPYPLPDIRKPKPKKQASKTHHAKHQHKLQDRLLRQDSGSTSSEQFAQPRQHSDYLHPQHSRPGLGLAKKPNKGAFKRKRVVEDVGCIRAAAYQGDAFMQARMDVLEQQGVVPGNQAPADHDADHQAVPHTVRLAGGKQRGNRSALRDLSRDEAVTDASKWGLLKGRTQDLRFGRSPVHAWGLFAKQDIEPEEFIIEYVGQTIRTSLLDVREKAYERSGLGSSYLFRIDESWAVDATRQGGLARFINHSCDPNCYTKIITVDGHKHIVIYSRSHLHAGEELTYDYKFEYELTEEPIKCTCGASNCRGRLN